MDSLVTLTVLNETNDLCRIFSPEFTSASTACVDTVCAATAFEYCYSNSDTAWFAYQGDVGTPLTIEFLWGSYWRMTSCRSSMGGTPFQLICSGKGT